MPKKNKKKRRKKIILFLLLFILVIVALVASGLVNVNIENIYIHDSNILKDEEVIKEAELENYPNFYKTTSYGIKKKLLDNPFVKDVKVKKRWYNEVHIYIEEYKILFVRLDTNKIVLENKEEVDYTKELSDVPFLINYVPDKKYKTLIKKLAKVDSKVLSKVSEIKYDPNEYDEDRFLLYMNDENYVYITLTKTYLLDKYNEAVTKLEGKKGILYFDSGNYFKILK